MERTVYRRPAVLRAEEVNRLVGKAPVRDQLTDYLDTLRTEEEVLDLIYLLDGLQTLQLEMSPDRTAFLQESLGVSLEGDNPLVDAVIGAYGRLQEVSSDYQGNLTRIQQRQDFREVERAFPTSALDVNLESYATSLVDGLERLFDTMVVLDEDRLGAYSKNYEGITFRIVSNYDLNIYGAMGEGESLSRYILHIRTENKTIPAVKESHPWKPFKKVVVEPAKEVRSFYMFLNFWSGEPRSENSWSLRLSKNLADTIVGEIRNDANFNVDLLVSTLQELPNIPRYLMEMVQSREGALGEASTKLEALPERVVMDLDQLTS
ncbi:hypothetical protein HOD38_02930 [archaeon]|jgi:hypothetical protein|nr:hypothetical protein [archaeon]MBT4397196.1 hypothetical protein [archaeon]MBT4440576.1 hypothetical protein [archaeon]